MLRVLNCTFGAGIPSWAHRALRRVTGFGIYDPLGLRLLRNPPVERSGPGCRRTRQFPPAGGPVRLSRRPAEWTRTRQTRSVGRSGVSTAATRPPTAISSISASAFPRICCSAGATPGRCYELAFKDRLDARQLRPATRGYQGADWHLSFTRDAVADRLGECRTHPFASELIDLDYADQMLASWPARWTAGEHVPAISQRPPGGRRRRRLYQDELLGCLDQSFFLHRLQELLRLGRALLVADLEVAKELVPNSESFAAARAFARRSSPRH